MNNTKKKIKFVRIVFISMFVEFLFTSMSY